MRGSIKKEITSIFIGIIIFILVLVYIVNAGLLSQYHIIHKRFDFTRFYNLIDAAIVEGEIVLGDVQDRLKNQAERMNVSVIVMNPEGDIIFYTEREYRGVLFVQMMGYLLEKTQDDFLAARENPTYELHIIQDEISNRDFLEMHGFLGDGSYFLMQSPLESIRESAALANRFLMYVGIVGIVLGAILAWFFSRRISEPLLELTKLSKKMTDLDFDSKYSGSVKNEIGVLGENFNQMSNQLEQTISELKRANYKLIQDIEQKEKMADLQHEFLGNVSHELKTPIALIQGYAEGLQEGVNDDAKSRAFYCSVIMDEANKMNQMVKNLMSLNQLEFGMEAPVFQRFNLTDLLREIIANCEILIQREDITIDFVADAANYVWADKFNTEQVFMNYLTNAINYVSNENRIEVRVISQESTVRVTVFNSGEPIPEEALGRLWDKFYKVDKARTREYGDNGIGLSIVRAIMESFHQEYGVQNFENGVQFWFELDRLTEVGSKEQEINDSSD